MLKKHNIHKLLLSFFSVCIYLAIVLVLKAVQKPGIAIFWLIPVITVAWLYGWKGGLIIGLLCLPFNILLSEMLNLHWRDRLLLPGALLQGSFALVIIGLVLGWVSDLRKRLMQELAEKNSIENELKESRNHLEEEVRNKTMELNTAYQQLTANYQQLQASQAELRTSRDFLQTVIDNSIDGIVITDDRGDIISVNKPIEKLFGRSKEELVGTASDKLFLADPGMKSRAAQVTTEFLDKGHTTYEIQIMTVEKGQIPFECSTTMIANEAGTYIASVTILRDMSDRVRMEQQVRQSQKLEAIGTLAGGIAHDFNNILAAIIGYSELSSTLVPAGSQVRRNLEQVLKASERARTLVRQILAFSRKNEPERKPILLQTVLREVMHLIRATVPATIEIRTDISEQEQVIIGDVTELHQIVMNLCTNAVHAMQDTGGVLSVRLAPVTITDDDAPRYHDIARGRYVLLTVSDNGTGMDSAITDRIFDPFFTTKEIDKGTGMGLAVVHGIVKSYGGDITVESRKGKGSTFSVLLPAAEQIPAHEDAQPRGYGTGSESILLVDDEQPIVESTQAMLASLGYRVTAVQNPGRALELFKADPLRFDLVLTDQAMPHMTGHDLARAMLAIRSDVPVILCTGFSETIDEITAKASGIQGFIMKPARLHELSRIIRSVLQPSAHGDATGTS